jgi:DNA invertase Pin-like site-specific DNA recombinase
MSDKATAGLRFAALPRVSTEKQEQKGESLRTQRSQIERDVEVLRGSIVGWYGGQEHATEGWERKELLRLTADAAKGNFDAVIIAHADRWDRGSKEAKAALDTFKQHGIRFYISTTEYELYNPEHVLFLDLSSAIGKFQAANQVKKSILNRIARARRGLPTCGKLPFGRTFDDKTETWGIDPEKKAMVEDAARRYLAGEPMPKLAEEYGVNHSSLHKTLTKRCGTEWVQEFASKRLNIRETVTTTVPRLLPEETIKAIWQRVEANKTYQHGQAKHAYLLGRMVFCGHCGYAMFGQTNPGGGRYYRHAHTRRVKECQGPKAWVNADELEDTVIRELFDLFGNPVAVQRAIEEATPNREKVAEHLARKERIQGELAKVKGARERIIRFISKGTITEDDATRELGELRGREGGLLAELGQVQALLQNIPTPEEVKATAGRVAAGFIKYSDARLWARKMTANTCLEAMTWEERRWLVETVFGGKTPDEKRMGVSIHWIEGQQGRRKKHWRYRIVGRLMDQWGTLPGPGGSCDYEPSCGGELQGRLLEEVRSFAAY